jgi:minimal PKS chain-length factor (CLF/KS beta)
VVVGEGAAVLVLEALPHALQRGARIRAEVAGFGAATGAPDVAGTRAGCAEAMRQALAEGGVAVPDLLSANGDSTQVHDAAEAQAILEDVPAVAATGAVVAPKATHGMLFSAAAPVESAAAVLAIQHGVIPPTANGWDVEVCGLRLSGTPAPGGRVRSALVNSLGAFGEAASLLLVRPD